MKRCFALLTAILMCQVATGDCPCSPNAYITVPPAFQITEDAPLRGYWGVRILGGADPVGPFHVRGITLKQAIAYYEIRYRDLDDGPGAWLSAVVRITAEFDFDGDVNHQWQWQIRYSDGTKPLSGWSTPKIAPDTGDEG